MTDIAVQTGTQEKERIIFEVRPNMIPAIVTFENLTLIGIVVLITLFSVVFRIGPLELALIAAAYLLLAFPSFRQIFMAGSTTYVLTNRRVVIFSAGFGQKEVSISLNDIDTAKCRASGLQGFYGAGDIILFRRNLRKPVRLRALPQCKHHAEQINKAVTALRRKS